MEKIKTVAVLTVVAAVISLMLDYLVYAYGIGISTPGYIWSWAFIMEPLVVFPLLAYMLYLLDIRKLYALILVLMFIIIFIMEI